MHCKHTNANTDPNRKPNRDTIRRIMSEKKRIASSQEPRLDNSQVRNRESERLIDKYPEKTTSRRKTI